MQKLQALLPLLGWFYLSIFGFAVLLLFVKLVFKHRASLLLNLVQKLFYIGFGLYACVLIAQSLTAEAQLWKESKKTLQEKFEQKADHEANGYYSMYFQVFRSKALESCKWGATAQDVSAREYYYIRRYMYPSSIDINSALPKISGMCAIIGGRENKPPKGYEQIFYYEGKMLIRKK